MRERIIKVKVDSKLYDSAKKYKINIEDYLARQLKYKVNEITFQLRREQELKELHEQTQEQKIIKIIKKQSKISKFGYVSTACIIAEAELEWIKREEVIQLLNRLEAENEIFKPCKDNFQVIKAKRK